MRLFLAITTFLTMLTTIPTTDIEVDNRADENLESVIIEVEGSPKEHKAYLEAYYPYIEVIATYDKLFNGLALKAAPEKLEKIGKLDFVKSMNTAKTYEASAISSSALTGMNPNTVMPGDLNTTKYTGKGVKVGIVDTGIDYNHPDLEKNYKRGYDLVDLDDDPMETKPEQGIPTLHGTHVAGIIAADGELTGVAPDAEIYAYRALGPGGMGSSVQVIAAMEKAVEDGVDVINLSLGNTVNGPDYPTSVAVNRAADLGVSVVIANGNDGPENWTVGAPATATKAIAVGAAENAQQIPYLYEGRADKKIAIYPMQGAVPWQLDKSYPIVNMKDAKESPRGKIALVERGDVPFYEMAKSAEEQGAVAVAIYNNEKGMFHGMVQNENDPINIPVVAITKQDGEWLLKEMEKPTLNLETAYQATPPGIASFSSRGPVAVNWHIKPDILAPGTNIESTVPEGYQELQGTSMAAPHITGVIALLKEAHPNWSNQQIFGAIKTTAMQYDDKNGKPVAPNIQGMGMVQPSDAITTETIIDQPELSFGKMDDYLDTKKINMTIENTSKKQQTYTFDVPHKQKGMSWKLPLSFTLEKNERKTIPIELSVTTSIMKEGIHQGWLTLEQQGKQFQLPYLFVNKTADNPKAMGFDFSLKPFSDNRYTYQLYVTDPTKRVEVDLYDPESLIYQRTLLEADDLKVGMNEGELKQSEIGKPGAYTAVITVYLEDGTFESHETPVYIE
jgi:minor extracellular serine protease Vpr